MSSKLVVVSDSHGRFERLSTIVAKHPHAQAYIHCGDSETSASKLLPFVGVAGNNDRFYEFNEQLILTIENVKILVIHSHQFLAFQRNQKLVQKAKAIGAQLVLFGHSHVYEVTTIDGITLVNPGSCYYNRDGKKPCYAVVFIENKEIVVQRLEVE